MKLGSQGSVHHPIRAGLGQRVVDTEPDVDKGIGVAGLARFAAVRAEAKEAAKVFKGFVEDTALQEKLDRQLEAALKGTVPNPWP